MILGSWKQHDGFKELAISVERNLPPVLLLRAVTTSDDRYEPVVRDAQSGRMVASGPSFPEIELAMADCFRLSDLILHNSSFEVQPLSTEEMARLDQAEAVALEFYQEPIPG